MEIQKTCKLCGKPFIAHKITSLYCSHSCINKAYKAKKRQEKIQLYLESEQPSPLPNTDLLRDKFYLSPNDVAKLLDVSLATVYRYMSTGIVKALKIRARTRIRRSDLESLFDNAPSYKKRSYGRKEKIEYYTINEILEKYKITKKALYRRCNLYGIEKIQENNRVYYNKASIEKNFAELIEDIDMEIYYTPEDIMEKYSMTRAAVATFALRYNVPRKNRHHEVYYLKSAIDGAKERGNKIDPNYYTYDDIKEKYGFTTINISYYVNKYDIKRYKDGVRTMVNKEDFDQIIRRQKDGIGKEEKAQIDNSKKEEKSEPFVVPEGYYTADMIAETYSMTRKNVWVVTRKQNIPRIVVKNNNCYEKEAVDTYFSKYQVSEDVSEWLTGKQVEQQYAMTKDGRASFIRRHHIPSKINNGIHYYSKDHIDKVKSQGFDNKDKYYSVVEAMEKYSLRRDEVYSYIRYNTIQKMKIGNSIYMLMDDFDKIIQKKLGE